jgi:hypothetical protein
MAYRTSNTNANPPLFHVTISVTTGGTAFGPAVTAQGITLTDYASNPVPFLGEGIYCYNPGATFIKVFGSAADAGSNRFSAIMAQDTTFIPCKDPTNLFFQTAAGTIPLSIRAH